MNTRQMAIEIVNHLNTNFHLELKTVDAAAMTDDIDNILSQHGMSEENNVVAAKK